MKICMRQAPAQTPGESLGDIRRANRGGSAEDSLGVICAATEQLFLCVGSSGASAGAVGFIICDPWATRHSP